MVTEPNKRADLEEPPMDQKRAGRSENTDEPKGADVERVIRHTKACRYYQEKPCSRSSP